MSHQYSLKEEKGLVKVFDCVISGFDVGKEVTLQLETMQQTAHLKGFRKGKTPIKIIEDMYFGKIFFDVVNQKASNCIADIIKDKSYKLASQPKLDLDSESSLPADRNVANIKDLKMHVTFELLPDVQDIDLSKVDVIKYTLHVDENDITEELHRLATNHAQTEDKGNGAIIEDGNVAVIDFTGYKDGEKFEGGEAINHKLLIGSKTFIAGFEDGLIGMKIGEDKVLKLEFPKEYHDVKLAGQSVEFAVKIVNILNNIPAQINDDLAKRFGFNTLDDLRDDIKKSIVANYDNAYKVSQKSLVFNKIQSLLDFEVPHSMMKHDHENGEECNDESHKNDINGVRLSIFLTDYAQKNKIEITKTDFMQYIENMARMYGQNPQMIYQMYEGNKQMQENVYNVLFENKIFDNLYNAIPSHSKAISKQEFDKILKDNATEM